MKTPEFFKLQYVGSSLFHSTTMEGNKEVLKKPRLMLRKEMFNFLVG